MIKQNYIAIIAALLITCIQITAIAATDNLTALLDKTQLSAAEEQADVQNAMVQFNVKRELVTNKLQYGNRTLDGVYNPEDLEYGTPYKVVYVDRVLNNAFLTKKNLAPCIAKTPYFWEVPVVLKTASNKVVTSFIVEKAKGQWKVSVIGAELSEENVAFSNDSDQIKTALQNNGIEKADNLYHLRFGEERQDYLYANSANQEYFIPIDHAKPYSDSIEGRTKSASTVENSEQEKIIQTKDEVIKKVGVNLIPMNTKKVSNLDVIYGGSSGTGNTPVNNSPLVLYFILGCSAIVALLGWNVLHKKRTA